VVSLGLAVGLCLPAPAVLAAPVDPRVEPETEEDDDRTQARELYDRGKARFDTTDYLEAIELWTEAYSMLRDTPENAAAKAAIIYNLATAREKAYEIEKDVKHLRRAVVLMEQYAASIPALYADETERAEETRKIGERLVAVNERIKAHKEQHPDPTPAPRHDPSPRDSEPTDTFQPDPQARPFIISGAVLIGVGVAGLGVMAGGMAMGAAGNDISDLEDSDLEARQERFDRGARGNIMAYVGGAVGGAAVVAGAALLGLGLHKHKTGLRASLGPGTASVTVTGRF
jgi:tetratricopeptide (TPR) repeat protein